MDWTKESLALVFDHALLKPDMAKEELNEGLKAAERVKAWAACVRGEDVEDAVEALRGTGVKVAAVVSFPHGNSSTEAKAFEAMSYAKKGCEEIDFVIALGLALSGEYSKLKRDMAETAKAAHGSGALAKAILECSIIGTELIRPLCEIATEAGCDFVKTSTGFSTGGAKAEDVRLMKQSVGSGVRVKASGGIKTLKDALLLIEAGADRLGSSSTEAIVSELSR